MGGGVGRLHGGVVDLPDELGEHIDGYDEVHAAEDLAKVCRWVALPVADSGGRADLLSYSAMSSRSFLSCFV